MTTDLIPANLNEQCLSLDRIAAENQLSVLNGDTGFATALRIAYAIGTLRDALPDQVLKPFLALQNTALGFYTDKPDGYPVATVRDCLIEAVLRGARPYGNELNIISGRCYLTKSFYVRAVPALPGMTEVSVSLSVPRLAGDKGAIVDAVASWKLHGQPQTLNCSPGKAVREIAVRVNSGMGTDAILGKATRKAYKAIHDQVTGWNTADGELEEDATAGAVTIERSGKRGLKTSKLNDQPAAEDGEGQLGDRA